MTGEQTQKEAPSTDHVTMDPTLKAKWLEALRGGQFEQGRGYLYDGEGFCCLGVLAMVAGHTRDDIGGRACLEGVDRTLADAIDTPDRETKCKLENMNDGVEGEQKRSFVEIADWIEANL